MSTSDLLQVKLRETQGFFHDPLLIVLYFNNIFWRIMGYSLGSVCCWYKLVLPSYENNK